ncbi:pyridoxal phosphate-dependent aminotransferase [Paenibacillus sp. GP183]|jgi:aspartate aminotransferase|uniref:pyridoxal phosphate-dependent aminotransferase n=1 Tax=Paenibacillus sp. GP183 TaxID=1882751 RepID=UPI00089B9F2A|nr:pyridoxal phosphate-dependent aminotransferase [Paenibacillus sp. GP183]SEB84690.1 aspartate aminotransferase [Paenibacillus sp. GP183]
MKSKLSLRAQQLEGSATIQLTMKAKELRKQGIDVLIFGQGEPDFPTPAHINEAAYKAIKEGHTKYTPTAGIMELRQAICEKLRVDNGLHYQPDQVVVSGGAKHSLINIFFALLNLGDEVIIPVPAWLSYWEQVKLAGGVPVLVPTKGENEFKLTSEQLEAVITPKSKCVVINSPSNPTGSIYTREELQKLAEVCVKHDLVVISDEIYEKLIYDGEKHVSIGSLGQDIFERTITVNGFSKAYAMTGWRMGYAAAPKEIAKAMEDLQSHMTSNPTAFVQVASIDALTGSQEPIRDMVEEYDRRRIRMVQMLREIPGLECPMPKGAFYAFPSIQGLIGKQAMGETIGNDDDLSRLLLEHANILVVPGSSFEVKNYIRLSYATDINTIEKGMIQFRDFVVNHVS